MSSKSDIQWTDATWNPLRGCGLVSPGCSSCYAMKQAHRFSGEGRAYAGLTKLGGRGPVWTGVVRTVPEKLSEPLHWTKPRRIFVNSMSDLFHEDVPDEYIASVFGVMAACPQHTFQVLTKRAERMEKWFDWVVRQQATGGFLNQRLGPLAEAAIRFGIPENAWVNAGRVAKSIGDASCWPWPLPNVHLGVSVESQQYADERIPHLLRCPAAVRFLSVEPQIGPVSLERFFTEAGPLDDRDWPDCTCEGESAPCAVCDERGPKSPIDWVIQGGESGPGARPFDLAWARLIRDQCRAAGVPYFLKQLGARASDPVNGLAGARLKVPEEGRDMDLVLRNVLWIGGALILRRLKDPHGGDMSEWPEDLRVRQFPGFAGISKP